MLSIQNNINQFHLDLLNNEPITCNEKTGSWRREDKFHSVIRSLFGMNDRRLLSIGKAFNKCLNDLEKEPVAFGIKNEEYASYLQTAKTVKHLLLNSRSSKAKKQLEELAVRVAGLKYRIEGINGGLDPVNVKIDQYEKLLFCAALWKFDHPLYSNGLLSERDADKIEQACSYPKFAKALLNNKDLRNKFFKWSLRDNNDVDFFVQFPTVSNSIASSFLSARIGRFAHKILCIEKRINSNISEKIVTLPFFQEDRVTRISILDESKEVTLNGGWNLSIKKIFDDFAKKNQEPGDLELFGPLGIVNWNTRELGPWDPVSKSYRRIDLQGPDWWTQLPIVEELSKGEIEKRFEISLDKNQWLLCVKSSRTTADLDVDGRHGYLEILIPNEDGSYCLFPFGKFAERFPQTTWDLILFVVSTVIAKIAYPDENIYYPHRQHASFPIPLNDEEGSKMMELIRKSLIRSREGNLVFQFGAENCAHWVQTTVELMEELNIPNFFIYPLIKSFPSNPALTAIFDFVRKVPEQWQNSMLNLFDILLGSCRGLYVMEDGEKVWKSHITSPYRQIQVIYQPGYLHKQIEDNSLKGVISTGH